jgi:hypothetical protein
MPTLALIARCLAVTTAFCHIASAGVAVDGGGTCLDANGLRARLEAIATRTEAGPLDVHVAERTSDGSAQVELRVVRSGRVLLDRRFQLASSECASATALLGLVLDRLVTGLPVEGWLSESHDEAPPATSEPASYELALVSAASVDGGPLGGDLELGARLDRGRAWRFGGGLLLRESLPSDLGRGTVNATTAMATGGARYVSERWSLGIELRGGEMRLFGRGFVEDRASWVPWTELAASIGWAGRRATIGAVISGSPLHYRALVSDGMETAEIPRFRVGIGVTIPLWHCHEACRANREQRRADACPR